jgi:hypothetical protein
MTSRDLRTSRDRRFMLGTLGLTALIPGVLLATRPLAEERQVMGYLAGWGLALLIMVPSYMLLVRGLASGEFNSVLKSVLGGMMGRLVMMVAAIVIFVKLVPEPPVVSFLLTFALGYGGLTALELYSALATDPDGETA